jgi:hypothetical protein
MPTYFDSVWLELDKDMNDLQAEVDRMRADGVNVMRICNVMQRLWLDVGMLRHDLGCHTDDAATTLN